MQVLPFAANTRLIQRDAIISLPLQAIEWRQQRIKLVRAGDQVAGIS